MLSKVINKETILYTVFGILTSVLNVLLFQILLFLNFEYKVSNLISLVVVKITARGSIMLIDFFGLIIMVDFINFSKLPSKIFITILVVVLNYIIGKKHVFKNSS